MSVVAWFAVACLLWPAAEGDMVDDMLPSFMSRMKEMREVLLPMPEDTLKEALYHAGSYLIPLDSETELCRNHSNLMFESYLKYDLWALRMVDASSKLPSGVLDGHMMDIGSYDQCLTAEAPEKLFSGQMCIVETKGFIPDVINKLNPEKYFPGKDFSSKNDIRKIKLHIHLRDALNQDANVNPSNIGQRVTLPSSLSGSPCYLHEKPKM
ncbi:hypothetical protein J6590_041544 [Homalodisca vitripennis]|nr:hypothetical protein J6590_041544 [Homalodisca vitripennis]